MSTDILRLSGKVALITGGASQPGLGSASAERLVKEGAIVYITDVDQRGAEAVAKSICSAGGQAHAIRHDVCAEADWERAVTEVISVTGKIDILVNNAGIVVPGMLGDISYLEWSRQLKVNLDGVFLGTRRVVTEMRRVGQGGSIINISSMGGLVGVRGYSAYCASKGAVRLFTKAVALETARDKIRVNSVHPGVIWTNMQKIAIEHDPDQQRAIAAAIPMGEMGSPLDIANCVLFLASEESRYITGAEFAVDGGLTAQ